MSSREIAALVTSRCDDMNEAAAMQMRETASGRMVPPAIRAFPVRGEMGGAKEPASSSEERLSAVGAGEEEQRDEAVADPEYYTDDRSGRPEEGLKERKPDWKRDQHQRRPCNEQPCFSVK